MPKQNETQEGGEITGYPKATGLYVGKVVKDSVSIEEETSTKNPEKKFKRVKMKLDLFHKGDGIEVKGRFALNALGRDMEEIAKTNGPMIISAFRTNKDDRSYMNMRKLGSLEDFLQMAKEIGAA